MCDTGTQVVFELFIYFRPIFHRRMYGNHLAAGLKRFANTSRDGPREMQRGEEGAREVDGHPNVCNVDY